MRPGIQTVIANTAIRLSGLSVIVLFFCVPQWAAERHHGAIICREEIPSTRRDDLAQKLRRITGWRELSFDPNGALHLGAGVIEGGSNSARNLLTKMLAGDSVVILEDASNRADVVFAKVIPGRWKNGATDRRNVHIVLIDFTDFDYLTGDRPALEAFNVGWSLLHEIDHVVNDSNDSEVAGRAGECEDHINQMRRECNLPARLDYFFRFFSNSYQGDFRSRLVRLAFEKEDGSRKHQRLWVLWDATQVGGLDSSRQVAALR